MKLNGYIFLLIGTFHVIYGCSEQTGFSSQDKSVRNSSDADKKEDQKGTEKKTTNKENEPKQDLESEKNNPDTDEELILNDLEASALAKKM